MKKLIILLTFIISSLTYSQTNINPFEKLDYDKVIAYEFQGIGLMGMPSIEKCLKKKNGRINSTKILTGKYIKKLETILTAKENYGGMEMSCFNPHFAVVYYKNEKIVGTINICLECNYIVSSEKIPANESRKIMMDDKYYPVKGFSNKGYKKIYNYIKGLGFTKYLEN